MSACLDLFLEVQSFFLIIDKFFCPSVSSPDISTQPHRKGFIGRNTEVSSSSLEEILECLRFVSIINAESHLLSSPLCINFSFDPPSLALTGKVSLQRAPACFF